MKKLYAIHDRVSNTLGPIVLHRHDAAAIRMFGDVASDPNTNVNRHVRDHDLIALGHLDDDTNTLTGYSGGYVVVISGQQWAAATQQQSIDVEHTTKLTMEA